MNIAQMLLDYESQCREKLKEVSPELSAVLEELDTLNIDPIISQVADDLVKSFTFFGDPKMTGQNPLRPLQSVVFDFSDSSDPWAYGYGSTQCEGIPTAVNDEIFGGVDAFSDCGGFSVKIHANLSRRARDAGGNKAGRLVLARLAQIVHRALIIATKRDVFNSFPKKQPFYILISEHDLGSLLCFVVE